MRQRRYIMRRLNIFIALVAAVAIAATGLMAAAPALAYNVSAVYRDCETNGQLTGHYSRAVLQAAISGMPANMAEYSACQAVIQHALLAASSPTGHRTGSAGSAAGAGGHGGGGSGTPGSGGTGGATGKAGSTGGGSSALYGSAGNGNAVTLGGSNIRPGSNGGSAAARSLPAVLVVVLILLALTAVSGGAVAIRRRVITRHGT